MYLMIDDDISFVRAANGNDCQRCKRAVKEEVEKNKIHLSSSRHNNDKYNNEVKKLKTVPVQSHLLTYLHHNYEQPYQIPPLSSE